MIGHLMVGPIYATAYGGLLAVSPAASNTFGQRPWWRRRGASWISSALNNHKQNHYVVLGVPRSASSSDIKKAYRLLARKWHPDVSKDSQSSEVFKTIHLAYQVLSNKATRVQYDRVLRSDEYTTKPFKRNRYYDFEFEDEIRVYRWHELKKRMRKERYHKQYNDGGDNFSYYTQSDDESEDDMDTPVEDGGSFLEVLQSVFLSLFLVRAVGYQLALMFSSMRAMLDEKLDGGYKLGYLIAWVLGGRMGVLLSMCLAFASWACGKTSSSMVSLLVVAIWVASNLLSYVPLPQGTVLALLYMSIKLQVDLN